jgi:hypothetical protein
MSIDDLVRAATTLSATGTAEGATLLANQLRSEMERRDRFTEWLLRFTACRKTLSAVIFVAYMLLRWNAFRGAMFLTTKRSRKLDMNINQAAKFLFVSLAHVRHLLERGDITGQFNEQSEYVIDDASVEKYKAERNRAAKEYLDSQTEDNDPIGL